MNLKDFNFPQLSAIDMAFPTLNTDKELLEESKKRGFYLGQTAYNHLFSKLFFEGGTVSFKKDIDAIFGSKAWIYCRAFMQSWEPKHEEKEAICALIMSEILEIE